MRTIIYVIFIILTVYTCLDSNNNRHSSIIDDLDKSFGIDNNTSFEDKLYEIFTTEQVYPISIPWLEMDIRLNKFKKYNGNQIPAGYYAYPNEEGTLCVDVFNSIELGQISRRLDQNYFIAPIHLFYNYGRKPMNSIGLFVYDRTKKTVTHIDSKRLPNTIYSLDLRRNQIQFTTETTLDTIIHLKYNAEGFNLE